jgi:hypothetical protein
MKSELSKDQKIMMKKKPKLMKNSILTLNNSLAN